MLTQSYDSQTSLLDDCVVARIDGSKVPANHFTLALSASGGGKEPPPSGPSLLAWMGDNFDDDDREICYRHFILGESLRSIAADLGMHPGTVSRRATKITVTLRIHCTAELATQLLPANERCMIHPVSLQCRGFVGYAVSHPQLRQSLNHVPTYDNCAKYVRANSTDLAIAVKTECRQAKVFGVRQAPDGTWLLEVMRIEKSFSSASNCADALGQAFVHDLATGEDRSI